MQITAIYPSGAEIINRENILRQSEYTPDIFMPSADFHAPITQSFLFSLDEGDDDFDFDDYDDDFDEDFEEDFEELPDDDLDEFGFEDEDTDDDMEEIDEETGDSFDDFDDMDSDENSFDDDEQ